MHRRPNGVPSAAAALGTPNAAGLSPRAAKLQLWAGARAGSRSHPFLDRSAIARDRLHIVRSIEGEHAPCATRRCLSPTPTTSVHRAGWRARRVRASTRRSIPGRLLRSAGSSKSGDRARTRCVPAHSPRGRHSSNRLTAFRSPRRHCSDCRTWSARRIVCRARPSRAGYPTEIEVADC